MSGIVLELQKMANDQTKSVSELLMLAKTIASKLKFDDSTKWIDQELKGYSDASNLPDYRLIQGKVEGYNTVQQRWNPIQKSTLERDC